MRKEFLIAIAFGIGIGILIAFGIWKANIAIKTNVPKPSATTPKQNKVVTPPAKITITNIEENDVITENPVIISGITKPSSFVVISGEEEDYILTTGKDGSFSQEVELSPAVNQLVMTAYDTSESKTQTNLTLVYSSEFSKNLESLNTPKEKEENEAIKNVKEKLEIVKQNPKAYIGTVTDKLGDSLQIKDKNEEIKLVSVNPEKVSFSKIAEKTTNISYADVAIGDFVVAMGIKNGNEVLTAVRILVTDPLKEPSRTAIFGEIINLSKKSLTLKQNDGIEITLEFPKKWKGPDLDELENGQKLIAVGILNGNTLSVRTIEVVDSNILSPTPGKD